MLERNNEFAGLRERAGLSIEEAAQLLHVSDRSIRRYEMLDQRGSEAPPLALDLMRRKTF
jgi:predicted transcriptional regulator